MRSSPDTGFSLVELLVASAITMIVTLGAAALAVEAQASWRADSGRIDLQQRTRVAADLVGRLLREAGTGPHADTGAGPLVRGFAAVLPRRTGARGADGARTFRRDAFTVIRAAGETEQAVLLLDAPPGTTVLDVAFPAACALPSCGLIAGVHAVVFDSIGNHDIFRVTAADGPALTVRHHGDGNAAGYRAGSRIVPVETSSLYVDPALRALRAYDGDASDLPLVDDVVEMRVEYYGEARPPAWPRPPAGESNCLYDVDGAYVSGAMPVLHAPAGLVALSPALLTDGPWCGAGSSQFDADLLRVRRIRVTLRLQAADPAVRGQDRQQFRHPGSAIRPGAMVPDATVVVEIAPANLVQGW